MGICLCARGLQLRRRGWDSMDVGAEANIVLVDSGVVYSCWQTLKDG